MKAKLEAQAARDQEINREIRIAERQSKSAASALIQGSNERVIEEFLNFLSLSNNVTHVNQNIVQLSVLTLLCCAKYARVMAYDVARIIGRMMIEMSRSGISSCRITTNVERLVIWHPHQSYKSRKRWISMFQEIHIMIHVVDTCDLPLDGVARAHFEDFFNSRWLSHAKRFLIYWGAPCSNVDKTFIAQILTTCGSFSGDSSCDDFSIDLKSELDPKAKASDFVRDFLEVLDDAMLTGNLKAAGWDVSSFSK